MYASVTLDPLLLRPWEIARLTDFQIERLYRRPAERRAAQMPHAPVPTAPGTAAPETEDISAGVKREIEAGGAPSRAGMVNLFRFFGMTPKDANEEYDRQLADHNRRQRGKV